MFDHCDVPDAAVDQTALVCGPCRPPVGQSALVADPDMIANWEKAKHYVNIEIVHV